jgi:CRISPR/Cas system CSM-associated protein Csm2 small subunit
MSEKAVIRIVVGMKLDELVKTTVRERTLLAELAKMLPHLSVEIGRQIEESKKRENLYRSWRVVVK